jgi:hypothetical protein
MLVFGAIGLGMIYVVISTSLESNLFKEWSYLGSIPWMRATLLDFYANTAVLYAWIFYKEDGWLSRSTWLLLVVGLGSIAVISYLLLQLARLKPGEEIHRILLRTGA